MSDDRTEAERRAEARRNVIEARRADMIARARERKAVVPFRPDRPQSGMFDSHGDGHPPRDAYMPAHGVCTPAQGPETDDPVPGATEPENGPQTGA